MFHSLLLAGAFLLPLSETIASTFSVWQETHFTAEERGDAEIGGPLADPEEDGLPNLLEYALGGDPWRPDPGVMPRVSIVSHDHTPPQRNPMTWEREPTVIGHRSVVMTAAAAIPRAFPGEGFASFMNRIRRPLRANGRRAGAAFFLSSLRMSRCCRRRFIG